jgi:hypothetical protein
MSYRLLLLAKDGHLVGHTTVHCLDDEEAIAVAKCEVRNYEYVEVWRGGRPVCMCAKSMTREARLARRLRTGRFRSERQTTMTQAERR